jgi:hypothetical protein
MSTKQALRAVEAQEAADDFGTEFGPNAMALVDVDFTDFLPDANDPKTLVQRWRSYLQGQLDDLANRKAAAEKRIALAAERVGERQAAAQRIFEEEKAAALAEHVAALADAEADLEQLGACKDAIDLAVARLNKAS